MKATTASLVGMPVEIRLQILEYLLGPEPQNSLRNARNQRYCMDFTQRTLQFCPNHFNERECVNCNQESGVTIWNNSADSFISSPLFAINRKLSEEALAVFYRLNHFLLHDSNCPLSLKAFRCANQYCWSMLRSLTIFVPFTFDPILFLEDIVQVSTEMLNLQIFQLLHLDGSYQTQDPLTVSVSHAVWEMSAEKFRLMLVFAAWLELRHPKFTTSSVQIIPIIQDNPFHRGYEMDIRIVISASAKVIFTQHASILSTEQIRWLDVEILHGRISDARQFLQHPAYVASSVIGKDQPVESKNYLTFQELRKMFKYTDRQPVDFLEFGRAYKMRERERYRRKARNWKRNVEKRTHVEV